MERQQVRALLFEHLDRRLRGAHRDAVVVAVRHLAFLAPHLRRELRLAYELDLRDEVNWQLEQQAVDELGRLFEMHGIGRHGLTSNRLSTITK